MEVRNRVMLKMACPANAQNMVIGKRSINAEILEGTMLVRVSESIGLSTVCGGSGLSSEASHLRHSLPALNWNSVPKRGISDEEPTHQVSQSARKTVFFELTRTDELINKSNGPNRTCD